MTIKTDDVMSGRREVWIRMGGYGWLRDKWVKDETK